MSLSVDIVYMILRIRLLMVLRMQFLDHEASALGNGLIHPCFCGAVGYRGIALL